MYLRIQLAEHGDDLITPIRGIWLGMGGGLSKKGCLRYGFSKMAGLSGTTLTHTARNTNNTTSPSNWNGSTDRPPPPLDPIDWRQGQCRWRAVETMLNTKLAAPHGVGHLSHEEASERIVVEVSRFVQAARPN